MLPNGLLEDKVIGIVKQEYALGYEYARKKRELMRTRTKLYSNISDIAKKKIYDRTVRTVTTQLLAIHYSDEKSVKFTGRRLGQDELARNIENLAKFDYDEMGMGQKNYYNLFYAITTGVGIRVNDGWDDITKKPMVKVIDPISWIPDPAYDPNYGYRFHGFDLEVGKRDLDPRYGFFNVHDIKSDDDMKRKRFVETKMQQGLSEEQLRHETVLNEARSLGISPNPSSDENGIYSLYQHYTRIDGVPYIITLANDRNLIIRMKEIEAVRNEEKKDKRYIQFPVVITHFSPIPGDAFGECIFDILEDKQRARQMFANLNRQVAERQARGSGILVNKKSGIDMQQLRQKTNGPKYMLADFTTGDVVREIPEPQVKSDAWRMPDILQSQAQLDIGLDAQSLGVSPSAGKTATENQRVQRNANLKQELTAKFIMRAEKKFWDIVRYRSYQEHMKGGKKHAILNTGVNQLPIQLARKDFVTLEDINIDIVSKSDAEAKKEKQRAFVLANFNNILANADNKYAKSYWMREMISFLGYSEEVGNMTVGPSPEEIKAKEDVELINRNEDPADIEDLNEDHMTYIVIYQSAIDTPAKHKAIAKRYQAIALVGEQQTQGGIDQSSQNQMTSNAIAQSNQEQNGASSLQDVS